MLLPNVVELATQGPKHRHTFRWVFWRGDAQVAYLEDVQAFFRDELHEDDPASVLWDDPESVVED